jgi:hypothetical protein
MLMRDIVHFLRANPQAAILLAICIVLGLGTLVALMIGLLASGPAPASSNSDAGVIGLLQAFTGW